MKLAIMDVETTGLDCSKDALLEVAVILYETEPSEASPRGILRVFHQVLFYKPTSYSHLHGDVYEMHTTNGLFDECHEGAMTSAVDNELAKFLGDDGPAYPCGRNVHFDMGFIKQHFPTAAKRLHYRHVDITTLELMGKVTRETRPESTHRALHDAINELRVLERAL